MKNAPYSVEERFVRYVQIDTTADPNSASFPSSEKQKDLSHLLVKELKALGIEDAEADQWGYVYATIPATSESSIHKRVKYLLSKKKNFFSWQVEIVNGISTE